MLERLILGSCSVHTIFFLLLDKKKEKPTESRASFFIIYYPIQHLLHQTKVDDYKASFQTHYHFQNSNINNSYGFLYQYWILHRINALRSLQMYKVTFFSFFFVLPNRSGPVLLTFHRDNDHSQEWLIIILW